MPVHLIDLNHRRGLIHASVKDMVWIASLRRAHARWQPKRLDKPLLQFLSADQEIPFHDNSPRFLLLEVDRENLQKVVEWLTRSRQEIGPTAALLSREGAGAITPPDDRRIADTLLHEAGVSLTIASPRQLSRLFNAAETYFAQATADRVDALEGLPNPCWGPGWQTGGGRDRVC